MNSFHEYFALVAGSSVAGCHGPSSTFTSTDLSGVPSFSTKPSTLCRAAVARHARDERLQLHVGDRPSPSTSSRRRSSRPCSVRYQRAWNLPRYCSSCDVDLRQPLHVGDAVPAGHEQPQREALVLGQRLAVQRVGEERLRRQRLLARQAAAELLLDLELLRAELDFLLAVIGAEEDELARRRPSRRPGRAPPCSGTPVQRPLLASPCSGRALLPEHSKPATSSVLPHLAELVERQRLRLVDQAGDLQPEGRRIDLGMAVVLGGEELVARRERAVDGADVEEPVGRARRRVERRRGCR